MLLFFYAGFVVPFAPPGEPLLQAHDEHNNPGTNSTQAAMARMPLAVRRWTRDSTGIASSRSGSKNSMRC